MASTYLTCRHLAPGWVACTQRVNPRYDPRYPRYYPRYPRYDPRYTRHNPRYPRYDPRYPRHDPRYPRYDPRYPSGCAVPGPSCLEGLVFPVGDGPRPRRDAGVTRGTRGTRGRGVC